jgi:hypothetical protein
MAGVPSAGGVRRSGTVGRRPDAPLPDRRQYERERSRKRTGVKQPYTELIERRDADPNYTPTKHAPAT